MTSDTNQIPLSGNMLLARVTFSHCRSVKFVCGGWSRLLTVSAGTTHLSVADLAKCNVTRPLIALKVPIELNSVYYDACRSILFNTGRAREVFETSDGKRYRILLLSDYLKSVDDIPSEVKALNKSNNVLAVHYQYNTTYEHLNVAEALQLLLPSSVNKVPYSFEGQLARVNLSPEALPYKHIIGQVILDKYYPSVRAVVNKVKTIDNVYRTSPVELLAGDDNLVMTKKESGATFMFNYKDVYWNARLEQEHARIINLISGLNLTFPAGQESQLLSAIVALNSRRSSNRRAEAAKSQGADLTALHQQPPPETVVVADMMAGVGPFSVPLAMGHLGAPHRKIVVHANDLNPSSHEYLVKNAQLNKCGDRLVPYNMDGRDFILKLLREGVHFDEVVMNLPHMAVDMLDVFVGMSHSSNTSSSDKEGSEPLMPAQCRLPRIHVYSFSGQREDPIGDVVQRVAAVLQCDPALLRYCGGNTSHDRSSDSSSSSRSYDDAATRAAVGQVVRWVTNKKAIVRLSFYLPEEVARAVPVIPR